MTSSEANATVSQAASTATNPDDAARSLAGSGTLDIPTRDVVESTPLVSRLAAPIVAMLVGLFLVYASGFAQVEAVHNAAHDTRHAAGFPCH